MNDLKWEEFERVDLRVGTIMMKILKRLLSCPKVEIDFGASIGENPRQDN